MGAGADDDYSDDEEAREAASTLTPPPLGTLADGSAMPALTPPEVRSRIGAPTAFVVQFTAAHFGPSLGLCAFAGLWRTVANQYDPVSVPTAVADVLWWTALAVVATTAVIYCVRGVVARESCWADIRNNRVANFFFTPVICGVALVVAAPSYVTSPTFYTVFFFVLLTYQLVLSLLLYGEWLFGSPYSLRKVHPLYFMAVIGFFLLSRLAIEANLLEAAYFCFAIGVLFWLQVFTTLFSQLSAVLSLKAERPQLTTFLFLAPPAAALLGWKAIFELEAAGGTAISLNVGRFFFYIDLFLFLLLARLFPLYSRAAFNVGAWATVFPLSTAATACVTFAHFKGDPFWWVLATVGTVLATGATATVSALTVRAVAKGTIPASPESLSLYWKFHWDEMEADYPVAAPSPPPGGGGRWGGRRGRSKAVGTGAAAAAAAALPV